MKERSQLWLMILLLVGLIGASNMKLVDPVENVELNSEDVVMYNDEALQWDIEIEIDDVCYYYCHIEIYSVAILVDGSFVFSQAEQTPIIILNSQSWNIQEWRYSIDGGFNSVELTLDMRFNGYYFGSPSDYWNLHIGLSNDVLGISRIVEMDVSSPLQWPLNSPSSPHTISWVGGDQEVDSDQDGFTDVGASYSGPCSVYAGGSTPDACYVDLRGDDKFPDNPTQQTDRDGDGYGDNPNGSMADAFPDNAMQWNDLDGDGYGDNTMSGAGGDQCPNLWGNSSIDRVGCLDSDGDGYSDEGVFGDDCPTVWGNSSHDRVGCVDTDGDDYSDEGDLFPNNPIEHRDTDGDGVGDNTDDFPFYELEWLDSDGDGYGDNSDWAIDDHSEWEDSDGDGVGNNADAYPNDLRRSAQGDMIEPGMGFFSIVVILLTVILILSPKGLDDLSDDSTYESE